MESNEDKPTPEKVASERVPNPEPAWVRETAEAEIKDLRKRLAEAEAKIKRLEDGDDEEEEDEEEEIPPRRRKPAPAPKKSSLSDWLP